ncbi:MAG: hypothetical protein AB4038_20965 [Prochloraceae cyanobacterium]
MAAPVSILGPRSDRFFEGEMQIVTRCQLKKTVLTYFSQWASVYYLI